MHWSSKSAEGEMRDSRCEMGGTNPTSPYPVFAICSHLGNPFLDMKNSIACFLLALSLTAPVLADTLKFPEDKPVASITFPEGWKAAVTGETLTASSGDGTV